MSINMDIPTWGLIGWWLLTNMNSNTDPGPWERLHVLTSSSQWQESLIVRSS